MPTVFDEAEQCFSTIADFLRFALSQANKSGLYYGHGTDNAWDDMLALILGCLSLPLDLHPDLLQTTLLDSEKKHLCRQLERRIIDGVPVPYLTNEAVFCELAFYVDERVLIPRSPIAELIEQRFSPWINDDHVSSILDIGTGSGCIAIACCYAFPDAQVDAVDISDDALEVAQINRERHELHSQLDLVKSNCFGAIPDRKYDIIVSNPPYVNDQEMLTLPREYQHEPSLALRADSHGLAIVENILNHAHQHLHENGILVIEVGNSAEYLMETYPAVPFVWPCFERGGEGVFILTFDDLKTYFS